MRADSIYPVDSGSGNYPPGLYAEPFEQRVCPRNGYGISRPLC